MEHKDNKGKMISQAFVLFFSQFNISFTQQSIINSQFLNPT